MQERLLTMNIKISKEKYDKLLKEETERLEKELAHSIFPTIKFMVNSSLKSEGLDGETSMKDVQSALDLVYSILDDYGYVLKPEHDGRGAPASAITSRFGNIKFDVGFKRPDQMMVGPCDNKVQVEWYKEHEDDDCVVSCYLL